MVLVFADGSKKEVFTVREKMGIRILDIRLGSTGRRPVTGSAIVGGHPPDARGWRCPCEDCTVPVHSDGISMKTFAQHLVRSAGGRQPNQLSVNGRDDCSAIECPRERVVILQTFASLQSPRSECV